MKLIREIEKHEMLRRWAIGEVHVEFLNQTHEVYPQQLLKHLTSGNPDEEKKVIKETLKTHHHSLVRCMPEDAIWYTALLDINQKEFNKLYTLPVPDLAKITNYTYRVAYAAKIIQQSPVLNPRIDEIKNAFVRNKNEVQLSGITLLANTIDGPFTVIEGNGRLISLYQLHFFNQQPVINDQHLEVVIGFSDQGIT